MSIRAGMEQRLYDKIARKPSGCWEWTGAFTSGGQPQFRVASKGSSRRTASAVLWELLRGEDVGGRIMIRACGNARCVCPDPDHAHPVEVDAPTRRPPPTATPPEKVVAIRRWAESHPGVTVKAIAQRFRVHPHTAARILGRYGLSPRPYAHPESLR